MVILDNSTRWNSTYNSIKRGLKIKNRIRYFCDKYSTDLGPDVLSDTEWEYLAEIAEGLKPFHQATLRVEGNAQLGHHGSVWEVLPTLEGLLHAMEQGLQRL
jgi:hypothetical protein